MTAIVRPVASCLMILLLLTACGSSPPVRFYSLSSTAAGGALDTDDAVVLGLGPIRMAEYLNRPQIVTRGAGAELEVDEFSRWAEPLAQSVQRVVATNVDNLMDGVAVMVFPWEPALQGQVDYRLLGEVIRFDADLTGRVALEVQWGITEAGSGKPLVRPHRSRYQVQAGSPGDPAAIASAMNEALASFSNDVADAMREVL